MAGFLKRMFSFGKKQVEETPAPEPAAIEPEQVPEKPTERVDSAPEPQIAENVAQPPVEPEPEREAAEPAAGVAPEPKTTAEPVETPGPAPSQDIDPAPIPAKIEEPGAEADVPASPELEETPENLRKDEPATEPPPRPELKPEAEIEDPPEPEPKAPAAETPAPSAADAQRLVTIGDEPAQAERPDPEPEQQGWLQRLTSGLSRSSRQLSDNITGVFTKRKLDEDTLEELEDILIQADLGVETAMRITDALSSGRYGKDVSPAEVRSVMATEIEKVLDPVARPLELDLSVKPHVILVVGVNGTGKTTTIGKLAAKLRDAGLTVTLGAGDTFRAAAIEQLKIWADRTGSTFVGTKLGADAAGLAYEAYEQARDNGSDVVIIDTAGRLQNKTELMDELAKIVRVLQKHDPDAPHTVLQTLDATTGQNALNQVEIFRNVAGVSGLVMTKLDGTARGGILVSISAKFGLPVCFIGVGEGVDDLEPFRAADFAHAIAGAGTGGEKDQ